MSFSLAELRLLALSDEIDHGTNKGGRPRKPDSELKHKRRWRRKVGGRPLKPPHEDPKRQARREYLREWARRRTLSLGSCRAFTSRPGDYLR